MRKRHTLAPTMTSVKAALLVKPEDTDHRLLDTTRIHAEEAVTLALRSP